MAEYNPNVVSADASGAKLPDRVVDLQMLTSSDPAAGCRVFTHFNGPTDQLSGMVAGMCVLDPGSTPHPPHRHPEEEFMIVASGTGIIECAGKITEVGPGAIMYARRRGPWDHEYGESAAHVLLVEVAGEVRIGEFGN